MPGTGSVVARALKQQKPFASAEEEVLLALQMSAARVMEPWTQFLKRTVQLTPAQYNVLRILRGAHPGRLACSDISDRMIARDPDVTRLVDRLARRGLVTRLRNRRDRRVVDVAITSAGLTLLAGLDAHVDRLPRALLGHLGLDRLRRLTGLLEAVIGGGGTFP